jgi:hypothetical protein
MDTERDGVSAQKTSIEEAEALTDDEQIHVLSHLIGIFCQRRTLETR